MLLFTVTAQNITRIALPDRNVELPCDVTGNGATAWRINGSSAVHTTNDLFDGAVAGHNVSGSNIVVEDIRMNDVRNVSQYQCVIIRDRPNPNIEGITTILLVAGKYIELVRM